MKSSILSNQYTIRFLGCCSRIGVYKNIDKYFPIQISNTVFLLGFRTISKNFRTIFGHFSDEVIFIFGKSLLYFGRSSNLCEAFPGLEISISGLYKHIREKCALSLKQASKYTAERDAPRTLQLRFDIITQWKAAGVNYRETSMARTSKASKRLELSNFQGFVSHSHKYPDSCCNGELIQVL
ncbi:uncharacterized protein EV154DRAFT_552894 [Mucor mucedo]|uniref:uncharacterized protein n=1 Tax=Mucor mucedo TaxID=29922 RepID=UPI00221F798D|nr:uncharacterized protein EV154DRAFT_552894 [Mucor mucedo]KAI7889623.1 hypothetical protein EV154DRAFT_552894 [Mucor mucedo]